jgi:SAM-dependent methyltransferase
MLAQFALVNVDFHPLTRVCRQDSPCDTKNQTCYIPAGMSTSDPISEYALGNTDAEHERLIRQAMILAPLTERFFRQAGIGPSQRVLDLGSGVGDVAMLAARLVGPSGEVVGVERDIRSIARARTRVAEAGLNNAIFTQSDVRQLPVDKPFDAVVGRFILQFLSEPVVALKLISQLVRPGGIVAFHEPCWSPILPLAAHLPLWCACASLVREALERSGGNTEMGLSLYRTFQQAGLPPPTLQLEIPVGDNSAAALWIYELFCTLLPKMQELNLSLEGLGNVDTLLERIQSEVEESESPVPCVALIGAWSDRPANPEPYQP